LKSAVVEIGDSYFVRNKAPFSPELGSNPFFHPSFPLTIIGLLLLEMVGSEGQVSGFQESELDHSLGLGL
jgi:hypothetical protein